MNNPLALNPFKKGKKGEVEGVKKVETEFDPSLYKVIETHMEFCKYLGDWGNQYLLDIFDMLDEHILDSKQINMFFNYMVSKDFSSLCKIYKKHHSVKYTNKLIQDSYNAGNNNFLLVSHNSLEMMAYRLRGESDKPLSLEIIGGADNGFARESRYCILTLDYFNGWSMGTFSKHNTYRTKNQETYEKFKFQNVLNNYNKIQLLDEKGNILKEEKDE